MNKTETIEIQPRSGIQEGWIIEDPNGTFKRVVKMVKHKEQVKYVEGNKDIVTLETIKETEKHKYKPNISYNPNSKHY